MSSESGEQRPARLQNMATRATEPEQLPCPRCESTNTKFCYYNNYNLSQPRHFCKSCRRYWTRGGTLRNVPVGGGNRKASSKRSRTTSAATSSSSSSTVTNEPIQANPVSIIPGIKPEMGSRSPLCGDMNLNETAAESFSSFLNTQQHGSGFAPVGQFGFELGSGLHRMGFGLGAWDWPMEQVGGPNGGGVGEGVTGDSSGCNAWQIGGVEGGGLPDGDCYGWPDLSISTSGKDLK